MTSTLEGGPTFTLVVLCAFVALTFWSFALRDMVTNGYDRGTGYFLVGLLSAGSTMLLVLAGCAFGSYPARTASVAMLGFGAVAWVWLVSHASALKPLLASVRLAFNRVEARQKRAAQELTETEKRLLTLKADPNYSAAMREVDAIAPFGTTP